MRFAIFTHVTHHRSGNNYNAYAPYVREMNIWLRYVEEVEIIAPAPRPPKGEFSAKDSYHHPHINFTKVPSFALLDFTSSVKAVFRIPLIIFKIAVAMMRADHLHIRCPGNIGMLAAICQIFFPHKPKTAKYAGNWDPDAKQPWTYNLQKWILSNSFLTRNMQVLVYGEWPGQSKNVVPFFTASFSEKEIEEVREKNFESPYTFLFAGNLVEGKQPLKVIKLVEKLNASVGKAPDPGMYIKGNSTVPFRLDIFGDGPERGSLKNYIEEKNLEDQVILKGTRPLEVLKEAYATAHFIVLPSRSEGWPKAIAEGMFFGCIPIATSVSCVPWMLKAPPAPDGGAKNVTVTERGILVPPPDSYRERKGETNYDEWLEEIVKKIEKLIYNPEKMRTMSMEAQEWSREYTLERFEEAIKEVLAPPPPKWEQKRKL